MAGLPPPHEIRIERDAVYIDGRPVCASDAPITVERIDNDVNVVTVTLYAKQVVVDGTLRETTTYTPLHVAS